jgi:hypothetical protein
MSAPLLLGPSLLPARLLGGGALQKMAFAPGILTRDINRGGAGFVAGTVKERPKGAPEGSEVPVWRRVRLYDERRGACIAETWSDATTGAYRFDCIDMGRIYTVLSYDHNGQFVAVAASGLIPERM